MENQQITAEAYQAADEHYEALARADEADRKRYNRDWEIKNSQKIFDSVKANGKYEKILDVFRIHLAPNLKTDKSPWKTIKIIDTDFGALKCLYVAITHDLSKFLTEAEVDWVWPLRESFIKEIFRNRKEVQPDVESDEEAVKTIRYSQDQADKLIERIEAIANYKVNDLDQLAAHFSDNAEWHMETNGATEFEFAAHQTQSGHVETLTVYENEVDYS